MGSNKIYNQIINNGFHIFGAQPLWYGRDLWNFPLRNVICVFRIAPVLYTKSRPTVPDDRRTSGTKIPKRPRSSGTVELGVQGFYVQFAKVYMEIVYKNSYCKLFVNVYMENVHKASYCELYTKTRTTSTTFADNRGTSEQKRYAKSSYSSLTPPIVVKLTHDDYCSFT